MQPSALASPVFLAPRVIKSLAHKLRAQPGMQALSNTAALEVMSKTLGHASWHAANKSGAARTVDEATTPQAPINKLKVSAADRKAFYRQVHNLLDHGINVVSALKWLEQACTRWAVQPMQAEIAHRMLIALEEGNTFSEAAAVTFGNGVPLEVFALLTGERGTGLGAGLKAAQEMIP